MERPPERQAVNITTKNSTIRRKMQKYLQDGTVRVHRIPPVGLKCLSDRRRREMTALVGGDQGRRRAGIKSAGYDRSSAVLRSEP